MKKLTLLLGLLLLLTSCYSNPKDLERIRELESKIEKNIFEKKKECKTYENKIKSILSNQESERSRTTLEGLKYSNELDSCIYMTGMGIIGDDGFYDFDKYGYNYGIYDYLSGERLLFEKCEFITGECNTQIEEYFFKK